MLSAGPSSIATAHHQLCVGDVELMRTDSKNLLKHGLELCTGLWQDAQDEFDWADREAELYVIHQISQVHTDAICAGLGIDPARVPRTFPTRGNIGPASVPFTLAGQADELSRGDRVLLMGVGSGLNACCLELEW